MTFYLHIGLEIDKVGQWRVEVGQLVQFKYGSRELKYCIQCIGCRADGS